jgi:hypothetical protein
MSHSQYDINLFNLRLNLLENKINKLRKFFKEGVVDVQSGIKLGSFGKYKYDITKQSMQNADTLAYTLMFCVASQGLPWTRIASSFHIICSQLYENDTLFKNKKVYYQLLSGEKKLNDKTANSLFDHKFPAKEFVSRNYDNLLRCEKIWTDREEIFQRAKSILVDFDYYHPDRASLNSIMDLYDLFNHLPGLALVKAGFAVQLVTGFIGCFDSVNLQLYSDKIKDLSGDGLQPFTQFDDVRSKLITTSKKPINTADAEVEEDGSLNPENESSNEIKNPKKDALKFKVFNKKPDKGDKAKSNNRILMKAYMDFIHLLFRDITKTDSSEAIWNVWVSVISDRINSLALKTGDPKKTTIVTSGDNSIVFNKNYQQLSNPSGREYIDKYAGIMTPEEVTRQHSLEYLTKGLNKEKPRTKIYKTS